LNRFEAAPNAGDGTPYAGSAKSPVHRIGLLLIPGFSYIAFACAVEPLRMATMAAGEKLFEAVTASIDGAPVAASNGIRTIPDFPIGEMPAPATMLICGPNPIVFPEENRLIRWLQRLNTQGIRLGGLDTGSVLLARARLLNGYRCTIHWQDRETMLTNFPEITVSDRLYEIDHDRMTSGGGTATMDMMLHYISLVSHSDAITADAAELLVHERIRTGRESQRLPLIHLLGTASPKLRDAVAIMEANIEQPLTISEIADYTTLSQRQLERLFAAKLQCTPAEHYLRLRLDTARSKLLYSADPVAEIAANCGFNSSSYFARCYRNRYQITPSQERRRYRE